jgi:hypothetical protein
VAEVCHVAASNMCCATYVDGANKDTTQNAYKLEMFVTKATVFLTEVTVTE